MEIDLLASSFFNSDSFLRDQLYFFNTIHSVGMCPPDPINLTMREDPGDIWVDDSNEGIDLTIPDTLLGQLGLPLTTTMIDMQLMGSCFLCERCDESFLEVFDWPNLVC